MKHQISQALLDEAIRLRREFHEYCEPGWLEMRTASRVAGILTDLGYEVRLGCEVCCEAARLGLPPQAAFERQYDWAKKTCADIRFLDRVRDGWTAVVGILRCGEGPVAALRFDMDALYVTEDDTAAHRPAAEGFSSCVPGVMHACGHDGHTAIGLCLARLLAESRELLHGTIKLVFQPAEEGVRGAAAMAESGILSDVDAIFAGHIYPKQPDSHAEIGVFSGEYGAVATTKYDVTFRGAAAHAGMFPEQGRNALLAAANAVVNLAAISRRGDSATQVNVGTFVARGQRNVVCDNARVELEVRGQTTQANEYMQSRALTVLAAAAQMYDCTHEVKVAGHADALQNSQELTAWFRALCRKEEIRTQDVRGFGSGSEDFACLAARVCAHGGRSLYFHILADCAAVNHASRFDFDERVLGTAIGVFYVIVQHFMGSSCENA